MVMVTSWNDWNEDTGIEPIPGQPTSLDDSPSDNAYTQGYLYGGEGTKALRTIRQDVRTLGAAYVAKRDESATANQHIPRSAQC